jgi:DNA-directed RNA polymerase specialized sigma24 family protein
MQELNLNGAQIRNAVNNGWKSEYVDEAIFNYHGYIYKVACQKSGGGHNCYHYQLCKECQSVVSIKLFGKIPRFSINPGMSDRDIENTFDTFMKRTIANAVTDFLEIVSNRNKKESLFEPERFDNPSEDSLIRVLHTDTYDIDNFYFRLFNGGIIEIRNTLLGLALTALNENKRSVFWASVLFEMTDEHIGHLFSMNFETVKYNKKTAKAFLKEKLGRYYEHEEKVMKNQKTNCFAYKSDYCCVLEELICEDKNCPFFKTDRQYTAALTKSMEALAKLPKERQKNIADHYYGGKMPWHDDAETFATYGRRCGKT